MHESEGTGVQRLTRTSLEAVLHKLAVGSRGGTLENLVATVALVVEERVSQVLHVHTDLVRTSRLENTLHESHIADAVQHLVVCHRMLAYGGVGKHSHLQAVVRVARYLAAHGTRLLLERAPYERVVVALGRLVEELYAQRRLGIGSLRHHEQSRRILVDAVHQSHPRIVGVVVGIVAQVPCDGVHQRTVIVAAARVHHHARRLVDHHQVVVLVDDIERDILRLNVRIHARAVHHQCHDVARLHTIVALHRLAVHMEASSLSGLLYAVARGMRQVVDEKLVHTHQLLTLVGHHAEVLVERRSLVGGTIQVDVLVQQLVHFVNHSRPFV